MITSARDLLETVPYLRAPPIRVWEMCWHAVCDYQSQKSVLIGEKRVTLFGILAQSAAKRVDVIVSPQAKEETGRRAEELSK